MSVFRHQVDFYGWVAAAVKDLAGLDVGDEGHGSLYVIRAMAWWYLVEDEAYVFAKIGIRTPNTNLSACPESLVNVEEKRFLPSKTD